jgi:imidazoleglycerol phosphate synthase glutamine amidotransferase subunit HisH
MRIQDMISGLGGIAGGKPFGKQQSANRMGQGQMPFMGMLSGIHHPASRAAPQGRAYGLPQMMGQMQQFNRTGQRGAPQMDWRRIMQRYPMGFGG